MRDDFETGAVRLVNDGAVVHGIEFFDGAATVVHPDFDKSRFVRYEISDTVSSLIGAAYAVG